MRYGRVRHIADANLLLPLLTEGHARRGPAAKWWEDCDDDTVADAGPLDGCLACRARPVDRLRNGHVRPRIPLVCQAQIVPASSGSLTDSATGDVPLKLQVSGMSGEGHEAKRHILRRLEARCGFKRAHLYKLIGEGKFPRPLRIGGPAVGWNSVEVEQWIAAQLQRRA